MKIHVRHRLLALVVGVALLSACAAGRGAPREAPIESSGLVRGYSFAVAGKSYTVHRVSARRNLFSISTDDEGPGDRATMRKVVRLAFGCHALELVETMPPWQAAEATGAVCTGGYQRYNRTR